MRSTRFSSELNKPTEALIAQLGNKLNSKTVSELREQTCVTLNLSLKKLTLEDIRIIVEYLLANPFSLQHVDLSRNDIDHAQASLLAAAIAVNTQLISLNLSINRIIEAQSLDNLIQALQYNNTLVKLDLSFQIFPGGGICFHMESTKAHLLQKKLVENLNRPFVLCMLLCLGNFQRDSELSFLIPDVIHLVCHQVLSVFPETTNNALSVCTSGPGFFANIQTSNWKLIITGAIMSVFNFHHVATSCEKHKGITLFFQGEDNLNSNQKDFLKKLKTYSESSTLNLTTGRCTFFISNLDGVKKLFSDLELIDKKPYSLDKDIRAVMFCDQYHLLDNRTTNCLGM